MSLVKLHVAPSDWGTLPFHDLANLFHLLEGEEFEAFVASFIEHGYNAENPVVLYEGKVLDGRNRLRAALRAGCIPTFADFVPEGPLTALVWVILQNLNRRHLHPDQRAALAMELRPMLAAEQAQARVEAIRAANLGEVGHNHRTGGISPPSYDDDTDQSRPREKHPTRKALARQADVKEDRIRRIEGVQKADPDWQKGETSSPIVKAIGLGKMTLAEAERELGLIRTRTGRVAEERGDSEASVKRERQLERAGAYDLLKQVQAGEISAWEGIRRLKERQSNPPPAGKEESEPVPQEAAPVELDEAAPLPAAPSRESLRTVVQQVVTGECDALRFRTDETPRKRWFTEERRPPLVTFKSNPSTMQTALLVFYSNCELRETAAAILEFLDYPAEWVASIRAMVVTDEPPVVEEFDREALIRAGKRKEKEAR